MNNRIPTENSGRFPEIEWFLPRPQKVEYAINIPNDNCFNLNAKLRVQMPEQITLGVGANGKTLWIKEKAEEGYKIPKSGVIKASNLIDAIKIRGISLPARYLTEREGDCWVATLVPSVSPLPLPKKTPKKPRINGLKTMLP